MFDSLELILQEKRVPLIMQWELTNRCNLNCVHCYNDKGPNREASTDEIKGIMDQLADAGCMFITFTGGEPLARNDFFEIASYARSKGFGIRIFSNGTLIDKEAAVSIRDLHPISVEITLYGAGPDTYRKVTGDSSGYDKVSATVNELLSLGVTVVAKGMLLKENYSERKEMHRWAEKRGLELTEAYLVLPKANGSMEPLEHQISDENLGELAREKLNRNGGPEDYPERVETSEQRVCSVGEGKAFISCKGILSPCYAIRKGLGNLLVEPFMDIWERSSLLERLGHLRYKDIPICSDCSLLSYCNPCIGLFFNNGDYTLRDLIKCRTTKITFEETERWKRN